MSGGILMGVNNSNRELFYGLIRIHVLLHARHEPIFGLAMMEELAHHGYRIGPGTLYPLLHGLERSGLLKSLPGQIGGRARRLYRITPAGRRALAKATGQGGRVAPRASRGTPATDRWGDELIGDLKGLEPNGWLRRRAPVSLPRSQCGPRRADPQLESLPEQP